MRSTAIVAGLALLVAATVSGQNHVTGGDFATSLEAWHHDPNTRGTSAWSEHDEVDSPSDGSAQLVSTASEAGVLVVLLEQCVPVAAGQAYVLSHKARFADAQTTTGWAESEVSWYSGPICTDRISGNAILTSGTTPPVWVPTSETFTAPAGAASALVEVGVDKIEAGGSLMVFVDDVSLVPAGVPADTVKGWLPVVGSLAGNFGAFFRTSVRILNPNTSTLSGRVVFHRGGQPESASDPSMGYSLAPGQSFAWDDVVGAMGLSGIGSMDVTGNLPAPPVVVARVFDDAGAEGTTGFSEPLFEAVTQSAPPPPGIVGHLLPPGDARYRYNVGIRVLQAPVDLTVDVLSPAGAVVHTLTRTYSQNTFAQTPADQFAGVALEFGQTLRITGQPNFFILYGATVDNTTNDPSAQFLTPYRALQP
jgi:hypothetical protein